MENKSTQDICYVIREVCNERHKALEDKIDDLRSDNRDTNQNIDELRKEINANFTNFKADVVRMITEASQGKVTITHRMSTKDKVIVYSAFISGGASITVALIQLIGSKVSAISTLFSIIKYILGVS